MSISNLTVNLQGITEAPINTGWELGYITCVCVLVAIFNCLFQPATGTF